MRKHFFFIIAVAWTALTIYVCLIKSSSVPTVPIVGIDKIAHILLHLFFTFFWGIILLKSKKKASFFVAMRDVFLLSFVFGLIIEFLQNYCTTSRSADARDVLANVFGALFGIALLYQFRTKI